jgi:hypothetical protein
LKVRTFIFAIKAELPMLKLVSLALAKPIGTIIGLLAVISIAPKSEAIAANIQPSSLQQPAGNLHSQIIFRTGERDYNRREQRQYRHDLRQQRRWERRQYNREDRYNYGDWAKPTLRERYNRNGRYNYGDRYNRDGRYDRNR